ncbi:MAG: hypothetical protein N3E37_01175 [Candidatus Micrarchaeota archaeon]|nr:hypothetical protein [Candidatus Micrarchaeota archaeon]
MNDNQENNPFENKIDKKASKKKSRRIDLHLPEHLKRLKRLPQALLPKDIGIILAYTDIDRNSVVLDAGFGSGFLAVSLSRFVKKVHSFEIRDDFYKNAVKNINLSKAENISLHKEDICTCNLPEFIHEKHSIDLLTLDLPEPEKALENILRYENDLFRDEYYFVCVLPTIDQLKRLVEFARSKAFNDVLITECQLRDWQITERACRPLTTQIVHSTFLAVFKKKKS